jgi:hypothetical protein
MLSKEATLEWTKELTQNQDVIWEMRFVHHSIANLKNETILEVLDEISKSDDIKKALRKKFTECLVRKSDLSSLYQSLLQE